MEGLRTCFCLPAPSHNYKLQWHDAGAYESLPLRAQFRTCTGFPCDMFLNKKKRKNIKSFLCGSGSGIRTARPSGYEPDELPTALSRDIGLQIYGHFLKVQILFNFLSKKCPYILYITYERNSIIAATSSFANDFCSPDDRFLILTTPSATSLPPTIDRNGIAFLSA